MLSGFKISLKDLDLEKLALSSGDLILNFFNSFFYFFDIEYWGNTAWDILDFLRIIFQVNETKEKSARFDRFLKFDNGSESESDWEDG